jgi:hypothetical protein
MSRKSLRGERGCEYASATPEQAKSYPPPTMRQRISIACIQKSAQAFCKHAGRANPYQGGRVVMGLVTNPPTPAPVRRQR